MMSSNSSGASATQYRGGQNDETLSCSPVCESNDGFINARPLSEEAHTPEANW